MSHVVHSIVIHHGHHGVVDSNGWSCRRVYRLIKQGYNTRYHISVLAQVSYSVTGV